MGRYTDPVKKKEKDGEDDLGSCGIRTWALQVKRPKILSYTIKPYIFICFYILQFIVLLFKLVSIKIRVNI
jgi:hypothetical protein